MTQNAKSQGRKSHLNSQNGQAKILHKKTNTFTIFAMNFLQEQLNKDIVHVEWFHFSTTIVESEWLSGKIFQDYCKIFQADTMS